jgi:hypothetical protein
LETGPSEQDLGSSHLPARSPMPSKLDGAIWPYWTSAFSAFCCFMHERLPFCRKTYLLMLGVWILLHTFALNISTSHNVQYVVICIASLLSKQKSNSNAVLFKRSRLLSLHLSEW